MEFRSRHRRLHKRRRSQTDRSPRPRSQGIKGSGKALRARAIERTCWSHALSRRNCFGRLLNPSHEKQDDKDDHDDADEADATVTISVPIAAEPAAEAAEQKDDEDDDEDESDGHGSPSCFSDVSEYRRPDRPPSAEN